MGGNQEDGQRGREKYLSNNGPCSNPKSCTEGTWGERNEGARASPGKTGKMPESSMHPRELSPAGIFLLHKETQNGVEEPDG